MVGIARQTGQVPSSPVELEDLSFENELSKLLTDDELRRGSSNNNISCKSPKAVSSRTNLPRQTHLAGILAFQAEVKRHKTPKVATKTK